MTLSTRAALRQAALRKAGGHVEASTAADTTSVTIPRMIGRAGGDTNYFKKWGLYEGTDAAADLYRIITSHVDTTGVFTIPTITIGRTTQTHEFYPKGDPSPYDYEAMLNGVLSETNRVVETALPTVDGAREHSLLNAPWIESKDEILDAFIRRSPNIIDNGGFELWGVGGNAGAHGWTLSGTGATVTRVNGSYGRYGATVTATGGAGAVLTQTIPIPIQQLWGKTIKLSVRVNADTAAMASVDVTDGTDTTQSTQHAGGSVWGSALTASHTVNAAAAGPLQIKLTLDATDGAATFETAVSVVGSSIPSWLTDYGDQHAAVNDLTGWSGQMSGTMPVIRTPYIIGEGQQIIVVSRQPYFELTAESGAGGITDIPEEAAVAGLLAKLAEQHISGPNAAKWGALYGLYKPRYESWRRRLAAKPRRGTTARVVVTGV